MLYRYKSALFTICFDKQGNNQNNLEEQKIISIFIQLGSYKGVSEEERINILNTIAKSLGLHMIIDNKSHDIKYQPIEDTSIGYQVGNQKVMAQTETNDLKCPKQAADSPYTNVEDSDIKPTGSTNQDDLHDSTSYI